MDKKNLIGLCEEAANSILDGVKKRARIVVGSNENDEMLVFQEYLPSWGGWIPTSRAARFYESEGKTKMEWHSSCGFRTFDFTIDAFLKKVSEEVA